MDVKTSHGRLIDFDAAAILMDDDIYDMLRFKLCDVSEQEFYDAYIENGCWALTDEQRIEAYRIYKECKEEKVEN